jgi:2-aminoethylphosphonate-pyruvate transaminase
LNTQSKWLFTPGPLTTSEPVKAAQVYDLGSRDATFIQTVKDIRARLLQLAGQPDDARYTTVLMQGSGTFGVESVISSVLGAQDALLIVINGAYGRRIRQMANVHRIPTVILDYPEHQAPSPAELDAALAQHPEVKMVAVVHCETTTGILNPLPELAEVVRKHGRQLFVDAMSSFGAIPVDVAELGITYLVSSANKCIEGVPGFSFAIADAAALRQTAGYARSLSLDLYAQWQGLEADGQFRFTPPVQSLLAFWQALLELEAEGGVAGRGARYQQNHQALTEGMTALGFRPYLNADVQSYIITSYNYPDHPNFDFEQFYRALSERGFVIYPGKLTQADCFRLGNIGRMYPEQMRALVDAIGDVLQEMEITL